MVGVVGIEPTWACARWILSPVRLPISPHPPTTYQMISIDKWPSLNAERNIIHSAPQVKIKGKKP